MSRSFRDSLKMVMEGAKEKTSDGMTPDAKHFRQDLHKVQDAGMKHLVQKDSETADYEKVFKGNVDKAPARLADSEPGQDVEKYVEYNEHLEIEEAKKEKKSSKMCAEGCVCEDCSSDKKKDKELEEMRFNDPKLMGGETVRANAVAARKPAPAVQTNYDTRMPIDQTKAIARKAVADASVGKKALPVRPGQQTSGVRTDMGAGRAAERTTAAVKPVVPKAKVPVKPVVAKKPAFKGNWVGAVAGPVGGGGRMGGGEGGSGRRKGGGGKQESVEIEVNGQLYDISEAHAAAIAAFVEKHGLINEGTAGEFISKEMKTPEKLTAKGKKQKIKQALAIFYSKKRRGENP